MPLPLQRPFPGLRDYLGLPKIPDIPSALFVLEGEQWLDSQETITQHRLSVSVPAGGAAIATNAVPDGEAWQIISVACFAGTLPAASFLAIPFITMARGLTAPAGRVALVESPIELNGLAVNTPLGLDVQPRTIFGSEIIAVQGHNAGAGAITLFADFTLRKLLSK